MLNDELLSKLATFLLKWLCYWDKLFLVCEYGFCF